MTTPRRRVELIRTLDEQKIANSIVYEAMHIGAVLVMDGAPYLRPDGTIDRERIHAQLRASLSRVPEFAMRLMRSPLGVTTPAWVPDEDFDPRHHVTFDDTAVPYTGASIPRLAGFGGAPLPQDRPLWDVRFTLLDTGEIALGARMHHVVGDGEWGVSVIRRVTASEPETPDHAAVLPRRGRAPRTRLLIPVHAVLQFAAAQDSLAAGWREYWRKPFLKRVRRMGGRNIAPLKEWWIRRRGLRARMLPPTHTAQVDADASLTARRAARLRGSLNDLLVASAMGAVDDDDRGIDALVPISRRRSGTGAGARNHIAMVRAHAAPGSSLGERVAGVREAVQASLRGHDVATPHGRMIGYATLMHLSDDERWFGDARVTRVALLPAGDPRSEISVLGTIYAGRLTTTLTTRLELDADAMAAGLRTGLIGDSEASAAAGREGAAAFGRTDDAGGADGSEESAAA